MRAVRVTPLALLCLASISCGPATSLSRILFTGASFADQEVRGIARGCVPITGAVAEAAGGVDPRVAAIGPLLGILGSDPLGCMLAVEPAGLPGRPYFVFCDARMASVCQSLPVNVAVVVTGRPLGPGGILIPSRVVRDE